MRICEECRTTIWPYLVVLLIASFVAFLTWLALNSAGVAWETNGWFSASAFVASGAVLILYMTACMRRHCGHR